MRNAYIIQLSKRSFKKFVTPDIVCMYMQRCHILEGRDETNKKHLNKLNDNQ